MASGLLKFKNNSDSLWWIYVATVVAMLPAIIFRDFTPDNELRYISIADEALANRSVFCFYNHGAIYADKPPLYLWVTMLGRWLFGYDCLWFISLFSLIPMLITGRVMDGWFKSYCTSGQRQAALLMLFTCGYFPGLALTLRMDMLMTMWIVLALREVWRMNAVGTSRRHEALLGLYTFLALFTKGPFGVLIPLLSSICFLCWTRNWRKINHIWGWPAWVVLLLGCALWWSGVYIEGGKEYIDNLLFHQTLDRASNAFTHQRPWWYYLVHIWYIMAPWSIVILYLAIRERKNDFSTKNYQLCEFRKFMVSVLIMTLLIVSCVSSKLQVYLLPAIPFTVYWGASLVEGKTLSKAIRIISVSILSLLFFASLTLPWINHTYGYGSVCKEIRGRNVSSVYVDTEVRRGENIDAYFNVPVKVVDSRDSTFRLPENSALILRGEGNNKIKAVYAN